MATISEQIAETFKAARRGRDEPTKAVITMLKSKVQVELKSGAASEENDALWLRVLASYAKQLRKAIAEFEGLGDRGQQALDEAKFELEFCEQFLPTKLDEVATEALVRKLAAEHEVSSPKQMGKLMGLMMKGHKDELDGDLARAVVQRVLAEDRE